MRIELFGVLREEAGVRGFEVDLPEGARAADALEAAEAAYPALGPHLATTAVAVGDSLVPREAPLGKTREIVLLPPVSGG